eukprot:2079338-Rhodomonas_salina.2
MSHRFYAEYGSSVGIPTKIKQKSSRTPPRAASEKFGKNSAALLILIGETSATPSSCVSDRRVCGTSDRAAPLEIHTTTSKDFG